MSETVERVPEVAGRKIKSSLAELEHRLRYYILQEQRHHRFEPDTGLIDVLCEGVRLCREQADFMQARMMKGSENEMSGTP